MSDPEGPAAPPAGPSPTPPPAPPTSPIPASGPTVPISPEPPAPPVPPAPAAPPAPQVGQAPPYGQAPPPYGQAPFQPAPAYGQPAGGYAPMSPSDEKMWSIFAHIGPIVVWIIAPLVIYLVFKDRGPFVRRHAAEALNFQITLTIAGAVLLFATLITFGLGAIITLPLAVVISIAWFVYMIIAAVAANNGQDFRYPLTLRLVS